MFNPVYTPFSISEVANVLEIEIGHCLFFRQQGKLKASLKHEMRPDLSVSHHSAVDLVEFTTLSSLAQFDGDQTSALETIEASIDFLCDDEWIQDWTSIPPEDFCARHIASLSDYLAYNCAGYERTLQSLRKHALPNIEDLVLAHWFTILKRCCGLLEAPANIS